MVIPIFVKKKSTDDYRCLLDWKRNVYILDHLVNGPNEGADTHLFISFVEFPDGEE